MTQRTTIMAMLLSLTSWSCTVPAAGPAPLALSAAGYTLDRAVAAARADAAERTGLTPAALELVSADRVTWSDSSLGCPQPDVMYTQALVPGYRVRLRGPVGELDYHASARGALVLCPAGQAVDPLSGASGI